MPIDVLMPQLSPTMNEGRLASWQVKVGDTVRSGDILAEVETDKATMEVEAIEDGVVHTLIGAVGATITVGTPIAVMKEDGEDVPVDYQPVSEAIQIEEKEVLSAEKSDEIIVSTAPTIAASAMKKVSLAPDVPHMPEKGNRVSATPVARKLAEQNGIDISRVQGTGPRGRIVKEDIDQALLGSGAKVSRSRDLKIEHTMMRKTIASRLTEAKQDVPHFYLNASVNMDALLEARVQLNDIANGRYKLTVNDFIIKACALALAKNPEANASFYDDAMIQYGNVDISVAVATPGGLITPIVSNADQKSMVKLSAEMKSLAKRARDGALKPEEYTGGGFSISNLGMYGVKEFKAIINPPQAAILAVGASEKRAIVKEGQLSVGSVMDMSLSVDHRAIDGALGAELLRDIKRFLENPILLVG